MMCFFTYFRTYLAALEIPTDENILHIFHIIAIMSKMISVMVSDFTYVNGTRSLTLTASLDIFPHDFCLLYIPLIIETVRPQFLRSGNIFAVKTR
jgi:hypothetical protein